MSSSSKWSVEVIGSEERVGGSFWIVMVVVVCWTLEERTSQKFESLNGEIGNLEPGRWRCCST